MNDSQKFAISSLPACSSPLCHRSSLAQTPHAHKTSHTPHHLNLILTVCPDFVSDSFWLSHHTYMLSLPYTFLLSILSFHFVPCWFPSYSPHIIVLTPIRSIISTLVTLPLTYPIRASCSLVHLHAWSLWSPLILVDMYATLSMMMLYDTDSIYCLFSAGYFCACTRYAPL